MEFSTVENIIDIVLSTIDIALICYLFFIRNHKPVKENKFRKFGIRKKR